MSFLWHTEESLPSWHQLPDEAKLSAETLLSENPPIYELKRDRTQSNIYSSIWVLTALNTLMLCGTITLIGLHSINAPPTKSTRNSAWKELSSYSPVYDDIDISTIDIKINGTLFPTEPQSWSRLEPGNEIGEAAWETFEKWRPVFLTRAQVQKLGKDPDTVARYIEGGYSAAGEDAYIASPDIHHKVHCLNELRKNAFSEYPLPAAPPDHSHTFPKHGRLWWIHLRHCTDVLLQDLLCNANADLITYQWVETQRNPFPDFSINRRCVDMRELERWQSEHSGGVQPDVVLKKPEGVRGVDMEEGYWDIFPGEREMEREHGHMMV